MNVFVIILSAVIGLAAFAGSVYVTLRRRGNTALRILACFGALVVISFSAAAVYLSIGYGADSEALEALKSTGTVTVTETDFGYFFDGSGTRDALIFYQGAKVEAAAYAPLLAELAEKGIDCFLTDAFMNFALFGINAADDIIGSYSYENVFIAGHSLGGVAAAMYAHEYPGKLSGVIFLASYPSKSLDDSLRCLSIYGTNDKVLDLEKYRAAEENLPAGSKEVVIEGGNHAQFGSYGKQSGDGEASVSAEEQRRQTAEAIAEFIAGSSP